MYSVFRQIFERFTIEVILRSVENNLKSVSV